jgi:two-component system alkaline phosphatase synthesis response regulator PhoP
VTTTCLVVEDEDLLGDLLVENLGRAGFSVQRVGDGEAALASLAARTYDLVILDVMLPRLDGFAVLANLRAQDESTPVLVLSARSSQADRIRGLELQADDYLVKPFHLQELLLRCHALLRRRRPRAGSKAFIEFGGNRIDVRARQATTWRGEAVSLTPAELALLRVLDEHAGEVVERRAIIDAVFGPSTPVKHRTLDNLVLRLRRLFEHDPSTPHHLHTVRAIGLRLDLGGSVSGSTPPTSQGGFP